MEDRDLVQAWKRGDREGFELLMVRYQKPLYYLVRSMVMNREEAEDITQQAFIRAFTRINRLRKPERFRSWLFSIGVNLARDHIRQRRSQVALEDWDQADRSADPERIAMARDGMRNMKSMLRLLPPRQQEVISMRLFAGLTFAEIGDLLGIREGSARSNFHFGIRALRDLLKGRECSE